MGSGRDLLYKPQVPVPVSDESTGTEKKGEKAGVKLPRGRDLGGVPGEKPMAPASREPAGRAPPRAPAHKSAYFNKDVSGVREVNQRASNMQALRGSQGATDLKRVVLPPAVGVEHPEPEILRGAAQLMGLDGGTDLNLEAMLGRQGQWAQGEGVSVEMIERRMAELESMVQARRVALARMRDNRARQPADSPTIAQAMEAGGNAIAQVEDLAAEGRELLERTAEHASGMHRRLAKMLGIKTKS